ncbi:hypothetical protein BDV96DRAFT_575507 [Lophiotrema nucula]|uniref:Ribosomal protein s17 n=1 Tax=Lophiotrema nucula TaxID=690887 RepID=A0A6A5ZAM8_9PLEO|nr:hypothetical protein BDV96DRAFT_575507 [Lophiotrema nucula]
MRFSTLIPLLLAAGVVQAQRGGQGKGKGQGQGQQNNGQQAAATSAAAAATATQAAQANGGQNNGGQGNGQAANNALCLDQNNVQTGSQNDGLADAEPGQAASDTDNANFINVCSGKTLTNGLQVKGGSCNGIAMGDIPSTNNMVSAVFTNPVNNDNVTAGDDITFTVQVANLNAGSFTNPDNTYYAAPQAVSGGNIVGHTHITCQFIGADSDSTAQPLNAQNFDFFKGINDAGDGNGALSATLAGGLTKLGFYRVCSMTSASNHQPVVMPVAQRGPQDDCVRFQVVAAAGGNNGGQNNGQAQQGQAQQGQAQQGQAQQGQAQQGQAQQGQGQQGQGQQAAGKGGKGRFGRPKFQARDFVA